MIALIKKLYANDVIRYIFFRRLHHSCKFSQLFLSAPGRPAKRNCQCDFRYSGNCVCLCGKLQICFSDKCETLKDHIRPFCKFVGARLSTMVIEVGGVWFFAEIVHLNDMVGKLIIQFVVMALNYVFSKFLVFTSGRK